MGMYDSFILSEPVKCPKCGKEYKEFQTKEFDCLMEVFYQNKKANYYALREETEEEAEVRKKDLIEKYPNFKNSKWLGFIGTLRKTDEVVGSLLDGEFYVYTWCTSCNERIGGSAVVKDGIFVEIKNVKGEKQ